MVVALEIALLTMGGGVVGAIIKGAWDYVISNRKQITELKAQTGNQEISAWEQWRNDNAELRREIAELRVEVSALRVELATHKGEKERALEENIELKRRIADDVIEIRDLRIQLDAALRGQDAYSIAARERQRLENEVKGKDYP